VQLQTYKLHLILRSVELQEPLVVNCPPVHLHHLTRGSDQNDLLNTCTGAVAVKLIVAITFLCAWRENFHNQPGEAKTIFRLRTTVLAKLAVQLSLDIPYNQTMLGSATSHEIDISIDIFISGVRAILI